MASRVVMVASRVVIVVSLAWARVTITTTTTTSRVVEVDMAVVATRQATDAVTTCRILLQIPY